MAKSYFNEDLNIDVSKMTVGELLSLSSDTIQKLSKREMSKVVRTLSLAANKRMNRLLQNSVKRKTGEFDKKTGKPLYHWEEKKSGKYKIATDAINYITDDGRQSTKFGVGDKTRNEMLKEFGRIREFMKLETSTIKGAVNVRKSREKRILNQTREDYIKSELKKFKRDFKKNAGKAPTKKQVEKMRRQLSAKFEDMSSLAWHYFRTFLESEGLPNNPYSKFDESTRIIAMIGQRTAMGQSEAEIHTAAADYLHKRQEEQAAELSMDFDPNSDENDGLEMSY